jgi:hypothetical protein
MEGPSLPPPGWQAETTPPKGVRWTTLFAVVTVGGFVVRIVHPLRFLPKWRGPLHPSLILSVEDLDSRTQGWCASHLSHVSVCVCVCVCVCVLGEIYRCL